MTTRLDLINELLKFEDIEDLANRQAKGLQSSVPKAVAAHYDRASGRSVIRLRSKLEELLSARCARPGKREAIAARDNRDQSVGLRHSLPQTGCRPLPPRPSGRFFRLEAVDGIEAWPNGRPIPNLSQARRRKGERQAGRTAEEGREGMTSVR